MESCCIERWRVDPASLARSKTCKKMNKEMDQFIRTEQWKTFLSSILCCLYKMVIQITMLKGKKNPKKIKHVFTNEFVPCADTGMKTWGYGRIMRKLHAWSLLAEFVRAKTKDIGEAVEGAYISYKCGTFRLNQCSWLKTLRRSLKGRA